MATLEGKFYRNLYLPNALMHYYHCTKVFFSSYFANVYFRGDNENCVVCTCGQPATLLTVKKDGPNKGKSREH